MSFIDPGEAVATAILHLKAKDEASGVMENAAMKAEFLHSKYIMLAQGVQQLTSAFMMLQMMQERQLIAQDIIENATFRLQNAQDRYNDSVERYGATSKEAIRSHSELIIAQNQLERAHMRTNMLMEHQFLEIIPMGINVMSGLLSITMALGMAESLRGGIGRVAMFGAMAAGMGLAAYSVASSPKMHSGGVVPNTGFYYLEGGETVNPSRGGGGVGGGGATTLNVQIIGYPGLDTNQLYNDLSDKNERLKRTRISTAERDF